LLLRGIRVHSKQELVDRIPEYFEELNVSPVVFRRKYKVNKFQLPGYQENAVSRQVERSIMSNRVRCGAIRGTITSGFLPP